jgi:hypothetical protein
MAVWTNDGILNDEVIRIGSFIAKYKTTAIKVATIYVYAANQTLRWLRKKRCVEYVYATHLHPRPHIDIAIIKC